MILSCECTCGNEACLINADFRTGFVTYKEGGKKVEHWDQLYISMYNIKDSGHGEMMLDPSEARELMWFLVINYLPGLRWFRRLIYRALTRWRGP